MVGRVERREVDMSMCGFGITEERAEVMDFGMPIFQVGGDRRYDINLDKERKKTVYVCSICFLNSGFRSTVATKARRELELLHLPRGLRR